MFKEIAALKEWESDEKFLLESWPTLDMTADRQSDDMMIHCIRGRVFPERDPYCFASFLVEIKLPPEYPFKKPQATILDPIYNPNFRKIDSSSYRYCWTPKWSPAMTLIYFIKDLISAIDDFNVEYFFNLECGYECRRNYNLFYEKALRFTFDYGRSRF